MKGLKSFITKCVIAASAVLLGNTAMAQQEVMYSQYMFNTLALNPAYAGSRDVLSMTAMGRYQWLDVPGAPSTYSFTMDMPFKNEKLGLGISAYTDAIGVSRNTGIDIPFSYKMKLGTRTTLALGAQFGVENVSRLLSNVANIGLGDPFFSAGSDINKMFPNAGAGFFMSNDKAYLGFSVPKLLTNTLSEYTINDVKYTIKQRRHFFTMMGFVVGKGNVKIKPSTMLRYTAGTPLGIDGNVNVWFRDKIAIGVSARKSQATLSGQAVMDAVSGLFELQLTPQLRIGYSYDYNMTSLNTLSDNNGNTKGLKDLTGTPTHEWLLRYEFGYGKNKILTPRYF